MHRLAVLLACAACSTPSEQSPDASQSGDAAGPDGGQLPAFTVINKFGHDLIRSVTVHKNGGEDRIVYAEASRIAQYPSSGVLPDATRLILEVTGGGCFVIEKTAGTWAYGQFSCNANPAPLTTAPNAGCSGCHLGAREPGVWTAGSLRRLVATHVAEEIDCPRGPGPTPCDPDVYD